MPGWPHELRSRHRGGTGGHDPAEYGERIGGRYDGWYGAREDRGPVAGFFATQTAGRPALELGIGTGRIAVPLAVRAGRRASAADAGAPGTSVDPWDQ